MVNTRFITSSAVTGHYFRYSLMVIIMMMVRKYNVEQDDNNDNSTTPSSTSKHCNQAFHNNVRRKCDVTEWMIAVRIIGTWHDTAGGDARDLGMRAR